MKFIKTMVLLGAVLSIAVMAFLQLFVLLATTFLPGKPKVAAL